MKTPHKHRREKLKSHIPFRLNLLFFGVFILFAILILRLGYMQILKHDEYQAEVNRTENTTITGSVARGEIYDAELRKLVGNEAHNTITYTRGPSTSVSTMAEVSNKLAHVISLPNEDPFESDSPDITQRDMKDYFYAMNREEIDDRVDTFLDENEDVNELSYAETLEFIEEDEINEFSEIEKTATAIFNKMNSAYALSTINVKSHDVTPEELSLVSENLDKLPGVGTGTNWERSYPEGNMMRSILGSVSSEDTGLPQANLGEYLAKGYSRNDRVGVSYLEQEFEDVLSGSKSKIDTETNNQGEIINQTIQYPGSKGDNLILSTDIEFQEQVEEIAINSLQNRVGLNDSIYLIALDPRNGDVLALTGKRVNDDGEIVDDALGNMTKAFEMGSSMKGATILAGYMDGVLDESNNVMVDERMTFQGSSSISSLFNLHGRREVDEVDALKYSSNIYMSKIAMRMGDKWNYEPNQPLNFEAEEALAKLRYYYSQFGLGTETGVQLPNEVTGQQSNLQNPGSVLYQSFGQYDTYTPLQLAQYISTIANGGTRYAPRFVTEVRGTDSDTGEVGRLKTEFTPRIMNTIDVTEEQMNTVHKGMYAAMNEDHGLGPVFFDDNGYSVAGKTGTAQAAYWGDNEDLRGTSVVNMTFTAFAPYENPEIAVAAVVPYLPDNYSNYENVKATRQVMDAYFEEGEYAEESEVDSNEETAEDTEAEE